MSTARSTRSTSSLSSSASYSLMSSRDMKQLQDTLIAQTNKMQQQTVKEINEIKKRLDSEAGLRLSAEDELAKLRDQVKQEQRRRKQAEKKNKHLSQTLMTSRNHLHNSALSMLNKTKAGEKTARKQYGEW